MIKSNYGHPVSENIVQCDLCPRYCQIRNGHKGFCFIRGPLNNQMMLYADNLTSGIAVDPIEKKPLHFFLPGSRTLSFGTIGCNLDCQFCQNWSISKTKDTSILSRPASPQKIAELAIFHQCQSISFTYNDPVIFLEFAREVALEAHQHNLKTVAVTAGYINPEPRKEFFSFIDATNVDLKSFNPQFYKKLCKANLENVLETLVYIKQKTSVWLEITNLIIPGENDSPDEITTMCKWIFNNLGPDVPLHFTRFHPAWKMINKVTPEETIAMAQSIAKAEGVFSVS